MEPKSWEGLVFNMKKRKYFALILAVPVCLWAGSAFAGTIKGKVTIPRARDLSNSVVYIENMEGDFPPPDSSVVMDQKDLTFIPHVLPVVKGTKVDFLNSDDVLHNVFSPDKCSNKFNLGTWPKGEKRSYTFDEEGCAPVLLCNVHPEMEAYVLTLQNPYFARTGKPGLFEIKDVPAGTYDLVAWNEDRESVTQKVIVPEKGEVKADFELKKRKK